MRVTKLVKYLPRFGWEPVVLTVRHISYPHYDERLLNDWQGVSVWRTSSLDPARLLQLIIPGRTPSAETISWAGRFTNLLFFPDAKIGWYPYALATGKRILRSARPQVIFSTAPPYTALKVGWALKRISGLPLVADFRDPWPTGFKPPPGFRRSATVRFRDRILSASDAVIAVNRGTAAQLPCKAEIIANGYDPEEFAVPAVRFSGFNVVHVGNIWENEQELLAVAEAVCALRKVTGKELTLRFVGSLSRRLAAHLAGMTGFSLLGLLPHQETLAIMKGADILLYLGKPGQAAGIKLYEYLGAGRPILAVAARASEAEQLIQEHQAGEVVTTNQVEIQSALRRAMTGSFHFAPVGIDRYNRLNQAEELAGILNRLIPRKPVSG